jgi:serine/threonine protein kinase
VISVAESNLIGSTVLGGYTVTELLGAGTFGTVYKAVKKNPSGEFVRALKHIVIPSEKQFESVFNSMGGDLSKVDDYFSEMLKGIVTEIQILNDLSEKGVQNIVRYYENDIITTESPKRYNIYILMEYLTPLSEYISKTEFSVKDVIRLGMNVLRALELCHDGGVIHRDIKDDNIFVSASGEFKIGDFGVSKVLKDSSKAESMKGTPNFLAPEVYLGKESYTKSVDLYSLGIVLYRLLNYSRNPFLPHFPDTYNPNDEDAAFEERMRGGIPGQPSLGGDFIGSVVVKAISGISERFTSAKDFYSALENALNNTPQEILDTKIKAAGFSSYKTISESKKEVLSETIGESVPSSILSSTMDSEPVRSAPRSDLFDTLGEKYDPPVPDISTSTSNEAKTASVDRDVPIPIPAMDDADLTKPIDSDVMKKIVYIAPFVFVLIGIIGYFVIIPNMYGRAISFIDWLFTNPRTIVDTLRDPNAVLSQIHWIIGIRILWYVWLIGFIISLFFVGRQLQAKPKPDAVNALLTGKEPYFIIQEINSTLKLTKQRRSGKELDALVFTAKKLEEKLSIESDFGYGKAAITNCENNIAKQLQFLQDVVSSIEVGNLNENISKMNSAITNINSLLIRRREMKKR